MTFADEFDTTVKRNRKKITRKSSKITNNETTSGKKKPKPGGTTRLTWSLHQEKKVEETIPRRDGARGTAWTSRGIMRTFQTNPENMKLNLKMKPMFSNKSRLYKT